MTHLMPTPQPPLVGVAFGDDNVAAMIRILSITTIEPIAGWPDVEKVVYESRAPGSYRELVRLQQRTSSTVQYLMRGRLRWRRGSGAWSVLEPGQALVYDAGTHGDLAYEGDPEGGHLEFLYINLLGDPMRMAVEGIVARIGHAVPAHGGEELIKRWSSRLTSGDELNHRCLSAVETAELAWNFLHPLARGMAPSNQLAERAMAMLTEQWQDPPPLIDLAKRLKVSREHLSRVLRATCGQPPALWLRHYRVNRAADLLDAGRPIKEVAQVCGFCSTPHFIHAFRRVHGATPGRWLRQRQQ
jgi:AraC-like DNA-binding protein